MEVIIDYILCLVYAAVFLGAMSLEKNIKKIFPQFKPIENNENSTVAESSHQIKENNFKSDQRKMQLRILIVLCACILLTCHNYVRKCPGESFTECFNFPLDRSALSSTLKALLLNLTVFVGPMYQDYKSSKIRIKFKDFDFNRFRWDEFKRLVIGPVLEEWVFRNLINNLINKHFENNWTFNFFSATLYSIVHLHNYKRFKKRLDPKKAKLAMIAQLVISCIFGGYMAYLFTKIRSIGAGFFIHGYCKFMGIPNIIELLRMDMHDHTAKKIMLYYAGGMAGFVVECLLLID